MPEALPNVARTNRALEAAWRSGMLPRPELEAGALQSSALRRRAPSALGDDDGWREPFERLVRSLREEAGLNPLGRAMAHGQLVMLLRARMRAAKLWRARPELLEAEIAPPIIILGQMRSGTTRMQRLLACDTRLAHTRTYESLSPVPVPARKLRARFVLALLRTFNPEILRIHPTGAAEPDEEFGWLAFGFGAAQFEAQWRVPSFSRWWEEADTRSLYREFKSLVQTNAWARGDPPAKPHILKAPQFLQDLPAVLETFPGARFIRLHRPLEQVVPSSASLVWNQMRIQSDAADREWIGREWLSKTHLRERRGAAPLSRSIEVDYEATNRDWRGEMRRIYDFLGLELTPALERRMAAYLAGAKSHSGHRYVLADFGLAEADVARAGPAM